MTILDTNVISELMRPTPEPLVLQWFNRLSADDAHLTSITVAEILLGIELLPLGKRRDLMRAGAERTLGVFAGQVLSFDEKAAHAFSLVSSTRRRHERIMSDFDAQIAAIAVAESRRHRIKQLGNSFAGHQVSACPTSCR